MDNNVFECFNSYNDICKNLHKTHKYSFFGPIFVADKIYKGTELSIDFGGLAEQGNNIISKYPIKKAENKFYYGDYAQWFDA